MVSGASLEGPQGTLLGRHAEGEVAGTLLWWGPTAAKHRCGHAVLGAPEGTWGEALLPLGPRFHPQPPGHGSLWDWQGLGRPCSSVRGYPDQRGWERGPATMG